MKKAIRVLAVLAWVFLLLAPACRDTVTSASGDYSFVGSNEIEGRGTVTYIDVEGGFYGIVTGDDGRWDPINLTTEFMQDGLKVKFRAKLRKDLVSCHMWGTLIEIISIEKL